MTVEKQGEVYRVVAIELNLLEPRQVQIAEEAVKKLKELSQLRRIGPRPGGPPQPVPQLP